ncbi:Hypothetical protein I596_1070 [Dokdonella koreensis DS-123]|uniref:Uncharacterized protein n=1 Tax=Dokdonella koreensis DS-123 TaxID=1300342 RepID=A0A160DT31_9GAMM|nr:Hypothetical protein I596_1070 [Dokdonella koreensis DS-123]
MRNRYGLHSRRSSAKAGALVVTTPPAGLCASSQYPRNRPRIRAGPIRGGDQRLAAAR